jgi:carboxypeptidase Taq
MAQAIEALKARAAEINHLRQAAAVLEWDMQCYMPPGAARARSEQMGTLAEIIHGMATGEELGRLISEAEAQLNGAAKDSDEARLVKNARRDYDDAVKIPADLAAEISRHGALAHNIWAKARAENDFPAFAPALEKTLELARRVAEHLGYESDPYDALLDIFEPGARAAQVETVFAELKPHLVDLTRRIVESPGYRQEPRLTGTFPSQVQDRVTQGLVAALGYDFAHGRQDKAAHPFCTSFSRDDVRITIRFDEKELDGALYGALHEAGHALYEQGIPADYDATPLGGASSLGVHESQSRMWENLVGRSRPFCEFALPKLQAAFPALQSVTAEELYRAVNRVEPSLIRVEADEVTYNLHVLLRFELEREMLSGRLKVADVPAAWNAKMQEYLGITPPNDALGVLQDVHWSGGMVGYFPTYTLGTLLSAQLWHTMKESLPDVDDQIRRGEFAPLLGWLRENVHRYGRKYEPDELVRLVTGEPLNARYYVDYLQAKYGELYELA